MITRFLLTNTVRRHNSKNIAPRVWFLYNTNHLNLVYYPTKYHQYIWKGIGVIKITRLLLPKTFIKKKKKKKKKKLMKGSIFSLSQLVFRHSNWAECRILTFKILYWHSNWCRTFEIYFDIQAEAEYRILTFEILFFELRTETDYRILTFEILSWHSNWGRIPNFDIQNLILTFKQGPYYRILTFEVLFWHSNLVRITYFDIRNLILTFEILFWHSNLGRISNFDIHSPE